jgi:DNA repair protein RecN (Recombination protein N)
VLEQLRISGLGVIADAELELRAGMNVLTGETGAGKTMVVTGLGLLLGARADSGLVRPTRPQARVEGRLQLARTSPLVARALDLGGALDEDTLLVSRLVSADGRSRCYVGGAATPVSTLAGYADELVAVHGQADQRGLLLPARQLAALDRFAGPTAARLLERYRAGFDRLRALEAELAALVSSARERSQEADLLSFGLSEVEAVAPVAGEDALLLAESELLAHADRLRTAAEEARAALTGADQGPDPAAADAVSLTSAASRALTAVRGHDPAAADLADRAAELGYQLSDLAADVATYADRVESDPLRLERVQQRRAELARLTRKYGDRIDDVLAWAATASRRLAELDSDEGRIEQVQQEVKTGRDQLAELAGELSAVRAAAAATLAERATGELQQLAMRHAELSVSLATHPDPNGLEVGGQQLAYGPNGVDQVELCLRANPGASPRPLSRGASGGELSRVMLALEVVLAASNPVPTLVFDEVDAGVGGKAAVEVGRRLAGLARSAQVLVVTHLPQVAAFADRHFVVAKSDNGSVTSSGVLALDEAGRVRELARMLAGQEDSASGRAHAEELLAMARATSARAGSPATRTKRRSPIPR